MENKVFLASSLTFHYICRDKMTDMRFIDVVLPLPLSSLFTYALPAELQDTVRAGYRVVVPFGVKKIYTAIVWEVQERCPEGYAVKQVLEVLDAEPVLFPVQLDFWQWIAEYYMCALGDVYKAALPSGMKLESESWVALNDEYEGEEALSLHETAVFEALSRKPEQTLTQLQKTCGGFKVLRVVKGLLDKGVLVMKEEVKAFKEEGVNAIVFGILTPDGMIDEERSRELIELARPLPVTFHRAFDMTRDLSSSLETLISLGVERVLTSGGEATVSEGADTLASLVRQAGDRIIVMPGCGINERNFRKLDSIINAKEYHMSMNRSYESRMTFHPGHIYMGGLLRQSEFTLSGTSEERVRNLISLL